MSRGIAPNGRSVPSTGRAVPAGPATAIPDSEANQKLIHRYYLGKTDPFIDQEGSLNATNNGTNETAGDWVDNAARSGDGSSDYITIDDLDNVILSNILNADQPMAIAWTIQTTDNSVDMWGGFPNNESTIFYTEIDNGDAEFLIRDDNGNFNEYKAGTVNDGNPYRLVLNIDPSDETNIEFWKNQSDVTNQTSSSSLTANYSRFDSASFPFFARDNSGTIDNYMNGIIDDICVFDDTLTSAEIQSYQNPWE